MMSAKTVAAAGLTTDTKGPSSSVRHNLIAQSTTFSWRIQGAGLHHSLWSHSLGYSQGQGKHQAQARFVDKRNSNHAHPEYAFKQSPYSRQDSASHQDTRSTEETHTTAHDQQPHSPKGFPSEFQSKIDQNLLNSHRLQLKEHGLEGIAYAAQLLLKLKKPTQTSNLNMPIGHTNDNAFISGTGIARKRGLPYAHSDLDGSSAHSTQAPAGGNTSGGSLYISCPRPARLFPTKMHEFRKGKYATTGGDRGFMTVFEYDVRGHTMMIDIDTSFVRFTSITQALGKTKVNFGRLVRTCPALKPHITKLKGGYLSIQGTWLPFDLAKELSRRIAWEIRDQLVPLFGYDFPSTCLRPDSEGFGQLVIGMPQKRARKRHNNGGPHQTSCYGPSLPISVIDGQTVEHKLNGKGVGLHHSCQQSQPTTFHYSKGLGGERPHWYGHEAGIASHAVTAGLESMMWASNSSIAASMGGTGLQVPGVGPTSSATNATCASQLVGVEGNGASPILSSPSSSNASSSSAQSYAAGYGLMVPPTVPSHSMGSESTCSQGGEASCANAIDLEHVSPTKAEPGEESRGCGGFANHAYPCYADASAQLSAWSYSNAASAYVCSSPTPPTPNAHAHASSFQLDSWQQPAVSH